MRRERWLVLLLVLPQLRLLLVRERGRGGDGCHGRSFVGNFVDIWEKVRRVSDGPTGGRVGGGESELNRVNL